MASNTEQGRSRAGLASVLRLFVPLALLVLFHTEPVFAVSLVVTSSVAPSEQGVFDAGVSTEAELSMCDLADASPAVAPGACSAAVSDAATGAGSVLAAPEGVAKAPAGGAPAGGVAADGAPADAAAADAAPAGDVPVDDAIADKTAPMCDSNAMSIAAPVEIPEVDRGRFEPLPCDTQALLSLLRSQIREGGIQLVSGRESSPRAPLQSPSLNDGSDGAAALWGPLYWPKRAAPSTLASHHHGGLAWQPGHRSRIDRPPMASSSTRSRVDDAS